VSHPGPVAMTAPDMRARYDRLLRRLGYRVIQADSRHEGLAPVEAQPLLLVVSPTARCVIGTCSRPGGRTSSSPLDVPARSGRGEAVGRTGRSGLFGAQCGGGAPVPAPVRHGRSGANASFCPQR